MNLDTVMFVLFPYVAVALVVVVSIQRYRHNRFSYSSLSSQFLESDQLYAGSIPWHYGILLVLGGHVVGFLFPRHLLAWNSVPIRLYILETTALVGGLMALIGLLNLIARRLRDARIRAVTSAMDLVILAVLLAQVGLGIYIATSLRWGSSWYAVALVPYLRSLFALQPDLTLLSPLPLAVKLHVFGAFVFIAVLPFSRLVHVLTVPVHYLWRAPQIVIWNRKPERKVAPVFTPASVRRPERVRREPALPVPETLSRLEDRPGSEREPEVVGSTSNRAN
jgi:nitrate reductase gamma subunit